MLPDSAIKTLMEIVNTFEQTVYWEKGRGYYLPGSRTELSSANVGLLIAEDYLKITERTANSQTIQFNQGKYTRV